MAVRKLFTGSKKSKNEAMELECFESNDREISIDVSERDREEGAIITLDVKTASWLIRELSDLINKIKGDSNKQK